MEMLTYFEGLINVRQSPVVMCDRDGRILFMNKFALKSYEKYGGEKMIGQLLRNYCSMEDYSKVEMMIEWFKENEENNVVFTHHDNTTNRDVYVVAIRDNKNEFIGFTGAHEFRTPETCEPYKLD